MTDPTPNPQARPSGSLAREVAVIVLVGAALGLGYNAYLLGSGPRAGLAWIKAEKKLVRLEDVLPSAPTPATTGGAPATAGPAQETAEAPALAGRAGARPDASGAPAAKPAPTGAAASPAPSAATPASASRTPAAATGPVASGAGGMSLAPGAAPPAAGSPTGGVPVVPADVPAIPETKEPFETGLAIVRRLHAANAAVFVDARSADEYAQGHIAGALHLSFDDVFRNPELAKQLDDRGLPIVAYCGGGDCDLSRNLAFSLIDAGKKRVLVFLDGLPAWEQAGLPVHKGTQP
ncbi:MAG: hypothetical protein IT347_08435 [Candidatus Eisenbacteria bacterium]|nr:hypothetical protein [Candidatus Eisenbacteria bacterium]